MIQVDLITGFLGAGKTTFIKKYAAYLIAHGEKVHIIENEFGGLPIDAQALSEDHFDVSQLSGGCMCCTGRASFEHLLYQAGRQGYDRILVEPSGIYDVNSFFDLLCGGSAGTCCEPGNVITVVDSCPEDQLSKEARYLLFSQLIYTGCVVFSKTQFRTPEEIAQASGQLQALLEEHGSSRDLSAEDICITKPWDELDDHDFERISGCGYRSGEYAHEVMDHMSIFSTSLMGEMFDTTEHLESILHEIVNTEKYGKVYRIKGYISDTDKNWYELNCSASGCFIRKADIRHGLFLVIGQNYDEKAIRSLFISRR